MEVLYVTAREEWRRWLENNYDTCKGIWFFFPAKGSGKECVEYSDAVEEALCFGWIDSTRRSYGETGSIQRFTPRRRGSGYSQLNRERLALLLERGMIHSSIEREVRAVLGQEYVFPSYILDVLRRDESVWNNFIRFPEPYKRIRISYIDRASGRPEEFSRRLNYFMAKTRDNKIIKGFGGTERYYGLHE